jgi:hypothetical protein
MTEKELSVVRILGDIKEIDGRKGILTLENRFYPFDVLEKGLKNYFIGRMITILNIIKEKK